MKKSELKQIIKEKISKVLNENEDRLNQILDKINAKGMKSLNSKEKTFLYSLNKTDVPQKTENYDYKIVVTSNKNYSFEMIKKFIERLFKNNGIKSEVNLQFFGLGMGFGYEIKLNNYFLYEDKIHNFLTNNGFSIVEEGPISDKTEIPQRVVDKVQKYDENYDIVLSPNHGHNLNSSQETERIGKILKQNGISNYFMSGKNDSIKLTLTNSTKEEKNKIYTTLSNSGYDVIQNNKYN